LWGKVQIKEKLSNNPTLPIKISSSAEYLKIVGGSKMKNIAKNEMKIESLNDLKTSKLIGNNPNRAK